MGWLGRGSFRGIGFCVKWIFGNWKMRVDARWLTATNPIWNAHLCAFTTLVDWKQWATDQLTTNELWFAKVFEKVARSTNKSAFFSKTSVVFFFCRRCWLQRVATCPQRKWYNCPSLLMWVTKFGMLLGLLWWRISQWRPGWFGICWNSLVCS